MSRIVTWRPRSRWSVSVLCAGGNNEGLTPLLPDWLSREPGRRRSPSLGPGIWYMSWYHGIGPEDEKPQRSWSFGRRITLPAGVAILEIPARSIIQALPDPNVRERPGKSRALRGREAVIGWSAAYCSMKLTASSTVSALPQPSLSSVSGALSPEPSAVSTQSIIGSASKAFNSA